VTKNLKDLHIRFMPEQEMNISSREFIKKAEFINVDSLGGEKKETAGGSTSNSGSGSSQSGNSGSNTGGNTGGGNSGGGGGEDDDVTYD
jgi:hypothetical protein